MITAIDYDGTIADTNGGKAAWIKANLGKDIDPWNCDRTNCVPIIGDANYRILGDWVYEYDSTLASAEVPGASSALRALAAAGDVYVISARPLRRLDFAREWLYRKGLLAYIRELYSSQDTSKADLCERVAAEVLIDDDARHLKHVELPGLRRILLQHGRSDGVDVGPNISFCRGWPEVLRVLRLRE